MTAVLVTLKAFATSANLPGKYPVYMSPPFLTISSTINVPRSGFSVAIGSTGCRGPAGGIAPR